jgi:hypothetical protein
MNKLNNTVSQPSKPFTSESDVKLFDHDLDSLRVILNVERLYEISVFWVMGSRGNTFTKDKDLMGEHYVQICEAPIPLYYLCGDIEIRAQIMDKFLVALLRYY